MPVIINSEEIHPFLPSLGSPTAIEKNRAEHQDIRPLEIAVINLMADKQATERQLATWLGNTMMQVKLTFVATDSYVRAVEAGRETRNTPADHIRKFYSAWSDVSHQKFDGLVVTGVNALKSRVSDEDIWPEVVKILEWSKTNVLSALYLCWGAQAALKYFHDIESYKADTKLSGLFDHQLVSDQTGILFGFPDEFSVPVSRWKHPRREDILRCKEIEIVADSPLSGPNMLVESGTYYDGNLRYPTRVYILNHPEYETETLMKEYERDRANNPLTPLPYGYYPGNDPIQMPRNLWRHTAHIYTNWVKTVYEATPFDINQVPRPLSK